jgi:multidrug efflux pump subunit AcrB
MAVFLIAIGMVTGGFVKFVFFEEIEGDVVAAHVTLPLGTSAETTGRAVAQIEGAAQRLVAELESAGQGEVVVAYMAAVGEQPYRAQKGFGGPALNSFLGAHRGEVTIELVSGEEREIKSKAIADRWRELCGPIPGAVELAFSAGVMDAGDPIDVELRGNDVEALRASAGELKERLADYAGVYEITDSFRGGKQEVRLDILPAAETLGITRADLARQVRQGFYGEEAQRIQRGRDEVKVMVRYPEGDRESLAGLESMRVRGANGSQAPFSAVARAEMQRGFAAIERADRQRTVRVKAQVDLGVATPDEILADVERDVLPGILASHRGVGYSLEGQKKEQAETVQAMGAQFLLALLAIYALMAIPFGSYIQPLIVMTAIPFGIIGAIAGHLLLGMSFSVLSLCGMAALAGVVVNDSLVLVDWVNQRVAEGMTLGEAARHSGRDRFRPIVLTSLTTFAGLTPLLLERSVQAQFLIPMAVALAFGVLFSTVITLVLVPAQYLILEDLRRALAWLLGVQKKRRERRGRAAGAPGASA